MELADRISWMKPSATLEINAKANQLRAEGVDVLSFAAGEPDFATPEHIREAAIEAMNTGHTRYTAVPGDPQLRELVAAQFRETRGGEAGVENVVIGCGAKQILAHFFHAVLDIGDEVIVPTPCWVSYPPQIRMAGGEVVLVPTSADEGWRLDPEALESAISEKTRALVLNAPCNPTGGGYDRTVLEAMAEVLRRHPRIWVISDEIYREITFDDFVQHSLVTVAPDLANRVLVVDGVSKSYSMTGWRVGWGVGPAQLVTAISRLAGQTTSCAPAFAQRGAIAALSGPREEFTPWLAELQQRRDHIVSGLEAMEGATCTTPVGTFYAMADIKALLGRRGPKGQVLDDAVSFCKYLLDEARVAAVPGDAFKAPGFVRFSFACATEVVRKGVERIGGALEALE